MFLQNGDSDGEGENHFAAFLSNAPKRPQSFCATPLDENPYPPYTVSLNGGHSVMPKYQTMRPPKLSSFVWLLEVWYFESRVRLWLTDEIQMLSNTCKFMIQLKSCFSQDLGKLIRNFKLTLSCWNRLKLMVVWSWWLCLILVCCAWVLNCDWVMLRNSSWIRLKNRLKWESAYSRCPFDSGQM